MDPTPSTTADIMKFYYEENRDPRLARELCLSIGIERLFQSLQYDTDETGGFDSEALGLMKDLGIDPNIYSYYKDGVHYTTFPEGIKQLQKIVGTQGSVNTDQIVDYIFRTSALFLMDHIDGNREDALFGDMKEVVKGSQIDPSWIWNVILDRIIFPGNVNIDETTMNEVMDVLPEVYVAVVAHDPEWYGHFTTYSLR